MSYNNNNAHNDDTTPRASNLSSTPAAVSPTTWRPPKSPLPPHRLAKLANALGVSTPIPSHNASFLSRSFSESAGSIDARRSPTPSAASSSAMFSSYGSTPSTSKYLLHVVPPKHLPHDSQYTDTLKTPAPPNAPGYHSHFRRGTLVPVHSTMQAQLGAIAKEYALPSTAGLVLYLISSSPSSNSSPIYGPSDSIDEEPGPRLSEDIWRHLWTRVLRSEHRDDLLMPPTSPSSLTPRSPLGNLGSATRSTPFLPQEGMGGGSLRPFIASPGPEPLVPYSPRPQYHSNSPITPTNPTSPSTPSTVSDRHSNNKSAPPSSTDDHEIEPATPDTSVDVDDSGRMAMLRADSLDLPGLNSPALIPVLAKVEFDIDRRKAGWYEPWLRSRKANHMKRDEHRKRAVKERADTDASTELSETTGEEEGDDAEKSVKGKKKKTLVPPIELITGNKDKKLELPPLSPTKDEDSDKEKQSKGPGGYARLSESPAEMTDTGEEEDEDELEDMEIGEDATAIVGKVGSSDPLKEVFGDDEEAWAEIRAENTEKRHNDANPNIVPLALTASEISALPDPVNLDKSPHDFTKEEDEVREMLDIMGQPARALQIPSPDKRNAGAVNGLAARSKVPPPLMFKPKDKSAASVVPFALTPTSATGLAYLESSSGDDDEAQGAASGGDDTEDLRNFRVRSPESSEKRTGAVFDDLDLGLDPSEDFDDDDPNDRRRSQLLMKAQLDEIERTMAQLSPRFMNTDLAEDPNNYSFNSGTLSPSSPQKLTLSPSPHLRNSDVFPSSPRLPHHPDPPDESPTREASGHAWPAVPFSMIKERGDGNGIAATGPDAPPSPPRLAVNGVTTSAPKSYMPTPAQGLGPSPETEKRRREQEQEEALYPPVSASQREESLNSGTGSPVIPLSPDPFGRYPSGEAEGTQAGSINWETMTIGRGVPETEETVGEMSFSPRTRARSGTTSRFSADSSTTEETAAASSAASTTSKVSSRATLMSVKSFKKLWRKSNNKSTSEKPPVPPTPPPPPMSAPAVPTSAPPSSSGRSSPMVPPQRPERPSDEQLLDIPDVPPPPSAGLGRLSPGPNAQAPPHPAGRMSIDQQSVRSRPSVDGLPPQHRGQPTPPPSAGLGRLSPGPNASMPPYPPGRTSVDQMSVRSRPSVDGYPQQQPGQPQHPPFPPNHPQYGQHPQQMQRPPQPPHPQQMQRPPQPPYPQQHPQHPQGFHPPHPQPGPPGPPGQFGPGAPGHHPQLSVGTFQGRNPNPPPFIMTHLQPSRSASGLDRLHFDQESPYPTSIRPARQSPRPPSPTPLPIIPEGEKNLNTNMNGGNNYPPASANTGTRKSILKKNGANGSSISSMHSVEQHYQVPASAPASRSSFERPPSAGASRGRRPSVINFGSTRSSVTSPDLPPSPQIPSHLISMKSHPPNNNGGGLDYRTSQRSKLTTSSSESWSPPQRQASLSARSASPPRSMASSRDSADSRPSFDVSQFEFVSPPRGASLSYPYNASFDSQQ
ncbi:hypothetical protein BJ165DRAFT_1521903 [Panaeolus papilionaceus]|nr:hypothetical protein BJ165DRAFT_1521903 [Panaeolus papilionaceus]